jgi:transcription-repair coupling factor (superfamily II helicase)
MYAQMLDDAVREMRGEPGAVESLTRVDLPVTAYVPPEYIAYEATKVDVLRHIARTRDPGELGDVRAELADRFGPPPEPVENLLSLQAIRLKASALPCAALALRGERLVLEGLDLDDGWAARLRQADQRIVYFKRKRTLSRHGDRADPQLLGWVEAGLDAILTARQSLDQPSSPGRESP